MNWNTVELGKLCEILDSKRKPITKRNRTEGIFPYYGATGVVDYVGDYIFDEKLVLVGEDGAKWDSGDKTAFIAEGKYWVNNHAHVLKPDRNLLLDEWLVWFFYFKDLKEFVTGLTVPKLNQGQLRAIPIPLPSLSTQAQILNKINALFSEIDNAYIAAEANIKNVEALFQSYLTTLFENDKNDWAIKSLSEVAHKDCSLSYGIVQPGEDFEGGLSIVRPTNLTQKYISKSELKTINPSLANSYKRTTLTGEEILLCVRGTTGTVSISTSELKGSNVTRGIVPIRFNVNEIDLNYAYYFFISPAMQKQIKSKTYGAALLQINISDIKKLQIKAPLLVEQKNIVKRLDSLQEAVENLKRSQLNKLKNLTLFKQAILQQAFSGKLVKE